MSGPRIDKQSKVYVLPYPGGGVDHGPIIGTVLAVREEQVEIEVGLVGRRRLRWRGKGRYWFSLKRVRIAQEVAEI